MPTEHILYPLFVMALLTFVIGFRGFRMRVRAVRQDGLNPGYFQYNRGGKPPEYMMRSEQNYTNQFELPILFYAVGLIAYSASLVDVVTIILAWLFVLSRIMHSYTHIRFNKLMRRRRAFLAGFVTLMALWAKLFIQLIIQ